jgi:hypothetical protein
MVFVHRLVLCVGIHEGEVLARRIMYNGRSQRGGKHVDKTRQRMNE